MFQNKNFYIVLKNVQLLQTRNKLIQAMHMQNQPNQNLYYYPQYQNSNLQSPNINQIHSNSFSYQKIELSNNINKMNNQNQNVRNKVQTYQSDNELLSFRKDINKLNNYTTQNPSLKYLPLDYTNPQSKQIYSSKYIHGFELQNSQKSKYLIQVKRKQLNSNNSKEIREQYYKGQQNQQDPKKGYQIQFQPFVKANNQKQMNGFILNQNKVKQIKQQPKRNLSPYQAHTRSSSYKQANYENQLPTKRVQTQNDQSKKTIKQGVKFNSPIKINYQYPIPKNFKQIQNRIRNTSNLNQKTQESIKSNKNQSTPDTSNSTSILFQSTSYKPSVFPKPNYPSFLHNYKQQKVQASCQTNSIEEIYKKQSMKFLQNIRRLQEQLEKQKLTSHQKEIKLKNMQHEYNTLKINFQKRLLINEKQFSLKKEHIIFQLRQENDKQISKVTAQLKQKSSKQIKDMQTNYENIITHARKQFERQRKQLNNQLQEKQKKIADFTLKNSQFEKFKKFFDEKMLTIQNELQKKNQMIANLLAKQQQKNIPKKEVSIIKLQKSEKSTNTQIEVTSPKNKLQITNYLTEQSLIEKNKQLQDKLSIYLINIDKSTEKYKECKNQLQKSMRKVQQYNLMLHQKDGVIRNMGKDLKNKDKHMNELKRNNQTLQNINKTNTDAIVKLKLQQLNQKYSYLKQK